MPSAAQCAPLGPVLIHVQCRLARRPWVPCGPLLPWPGSLGTGRSSHTRALPPPRHTREIEVLMEITGSGGPPVCPSSVLILGECRRAPGQEAVRELWNPVVGPTPSVKPSGDFTCPILIRQGARYVGGLRLSIAGLSHGSLGRGDVTRPWVENCRNAKRCFSTGDRPVQSGRIDFNRFTQI